MSNTEQNYLKLCKIQIGEKLGWAPSADWKQRDFHNLIELIENKTGISLSLSTLKRIWKPDFNSIPHPSTLDAFAQFLEYKNWLDYKSQNEQTQNLVKSTRNIIPVKKLLISFFAIILVPAIAIILLKSSNSNHKIEGVFYNPEDIDFVCNTTVARGVPNTVIFTYDASKVTADSFFIQQSWDRYRRDRINKNNSTLTSTYLYPGYHKAKLIANDSIIKEVGVRVNTNGWLSMARYSYRDLSPIYISNKDVVKDGKLHISKNHLLKNKVEINQDLLSSYFLTDNFENLSSSDFTFETRIKCDSILNKSCPYMGIVITGEGDMNYIPLTIKGCVGDAYIKIGDKGLSGKDNDFSALGTNIYQWQTLKVEVKNKIANLYLNQDLILEIPFNEDIKEITGCNLNFTGSGSIDFVKFFNSEGEVVYEEGFE